MCTRERLSGFCSKTTQTPCTRISAVPLLHARLRPVIRTPTAAWTPALLLRFTNDRF